MGALARYAGTAGQAPEPLEFCLLGPLVVRRDGVAVRIAVGKQRAVLAALLLHSERGVTLGELAEVVWGAGTVSRLVTTTAQDGCRAAAAVPDRPRLYPALAEYKRVMIVG